MSQVNWDNRTVRLQTLWFILFFLILFLGILVHLSPYVFPFRVIGQVALIFLAYVDLQMFIPAFSSSSPSYSLIPCTRAVPGPCSSSFSSSHQSCSTLCSPSCSPCPCLSGYPKTITFQTIPKKFYCWNLVLMTLVFLASTMILTLFLLWTKCIWLNLLLPPSSTTFVAEILSHDDPYWHFGVFCHVQTGRQTDRVYVRN